MTNVIHEQFNESLRPKVGVGVLIRKNGKILLAQRTSSHGDGTWALPGGHLEYGESWESCARRETEEETGLILKDVHLGTIVNVIMDQYKKHYVTIFMVADFPGGEIENREPHKQARWDWFAWDSLPFPMFETIQQANAEGFNPFDI